MTTKSEARTSPPSDPSLEVGSPDRFTEVDPTLAARWAQPIAAEIEARRPSSLNAPLLKGRNHARRRAPTWELPGERALRLLAALWSKS